MMNKSTDQDMRVIKRNGDLEDLSFDKILVRIRKLGQEANIQINYQSLVMKVIDQLYDKISTTKIDELASEQCAVMSANHPDYGTLAGRIVISNHQKNTEPSFCNVVNKLYNFKNINDINKPLLSKELFDFVEYYGSEIENMIDYNRDYLIDYFGFKTLERAYLFKLNGKILERPQHMWMRVAIGIHGYLSVDDTENKKKLELVKETYDLMSQKYFTHATPTLFNAGAPRQQLSSCYLIAMEEDSIDGIYNTLKDCAQISKYSGGIGLHIHNVRAKDSHIQGTNGKTDGIVPMLRVYNSTACYVNQCFTPDTWVYSKNGPTQMNKITTNDELITIDGTFKKVNEVIVNHVNKEILEIKITNSMFPVKVTKEHELYLIKNQPKMLNYNMIKNKLQKNIVTPNYYSASELSEYDLVGFPLPTFEKDNNENNLDYYKFYGIMLGNGDICRNKKETKITLKIKTKLDLIEFTRNYLTKKNVKYSETSNNICLSFKWSNHNNVKLGLSEEILYDDTVYNNNNNNNNNKQLANDFLHLPKHKILKIIEGLIRTDDTNSKEIYYYTTSQVLVMQLRYLLLRLGILTSGNIKDNVDDIITNRKKTYCLRIPKHNVLREILSFTDESCKFKYFEWNGFLWGRIKSIKNINYSGDVYDFNMIDNHNYLTDMGLVHNSGKRNGSFAIYLEPWHADVEDFLELRKNHGDENLKARDLFYALWISDLFMERVKSNAKWSLMCPNECPGLSDVYGDDFNALYEKYESQGKIRKSVNARDLWFKILDAQMETGTPYILYKDSVNKKSNQKNIGTIKSSNLCTEIAEYSDDKETAVCNLASIGLPMFVNEKTHEFDYEKLHEVTKVVTNNLNRVIDINFYPTDKTKRSNMRHRPIGIGVQGLADTFVLLDIPFHSEEAKNINKRIFETVYHASLERSNEIAIERYEKISKLNYNSIKINGCQLLNEYELKTYRPHCAKSQEELNDITTVGSYSSFHGSPASSGILQFDLWEVEPTPGRYDWHKLKESIKKYGLRNSLLVAPMPTASTSQILGFNECFEPFTSNLYSRRTLAGEFMVVNKYLMRELIDLGIWNEQIKKNIIANKGSIQQLNNLLSEHILNKYKIVWEIPMKHIIDMSADRGAFICQSQSLNLWIEDPTYNTLTSMHFYSWKKGLKTGIYYLRRKAKHQAQQFTIEPETNDNNNENNGGHDEICEMCSA